MQAPSEHGFIFTQPSNKYYICISSSGLEKYCSSEVNHLAVPSSYKKQFWSMPEEFFLEDTTTEIPPQKLKRGISNLPGLNNNWVSPVSSLSMQAKHKKILQIPRAPETS